MVSQLVDIFVIKRIYEWINNPWIFNLVSIFINSNNTDEKAVYVKKIHSYIIQNLEWIPFDYNIIQDVIMRQTQFMWMNERTKGRRILNNKTSGVHYDSAFLIISQTQSVLDNRIPSLRNLGCGNSKLILYVVIEHSKWCTLICFKYNFFEIKVYENSRSHLEYLRSEEWKAGT